VPSRLREAFVKRFCAHTITVPESGNTGVVCSYPYLVEVKVDSLRTKTGTKHVKKVLVRVYDLDNGGFYWMTLEEVKMAPKGRVTEPCDLQMSAILGSRFCEDVGDIINFLEGGLNGY
jgi:hypothetical protein